jgi:hypothetical protein
MSQPPPEPPARLHAIELRGHPVWTWLWISREDLARVGELLVDAATATGPFDALVQLPGLDVSVHVFPDR